jgi:Cu(I)/Ag(I) efflux system membrane fusion protein
MKFLKNTARLFLALAVGAAPFAALSVEEKKMDDSALMEPVKSILDHYLEIQSDLAKDSLKGVADHAGAIVKAVKGDEMKMLSPDVAKQADTLAQAKDLKAAREAFKPLSASLVKYLADNKAGKGVYHEGYCPMAKASWLQMEKEVKNPYYGKSMLDCGTLRN